MQGRWPNLNLAFLIQFDGHAALIPAGVVQAVGMITEEKQILVVEDEPSLLRSISTAICEVGLTSCTAGSLSEATEAVACNPGMIILDRMLPDGDGVAWLRSLRQSGNQVPVLILTARDAVEDRVDGLDSGADDYLVKPFALEELLARVHALSRRTAEPTVIEIEAADLRLNLVTREVYRRGRSIELSLRQFELLACLMQRSPAAVSREAIADLVWKDAAAVGSNVIEVQVNLLRKKLHLDGLPRVLHTVRGIGYHVELRE